MRGHNPRQKQSQKSFPCIYNTVAHPRVLANCYASLCQAISISEVANSFGLMGRRANRNSILGRAYFLYALLNTVPIRLALARWRRLSSISRLVDMPLATTIKIQSICGSTAMASSLCSKEGRSKMIMRDS
jgi:hypothetical protein